MRGIKFRAWISKENENTVFDSGMYDWEDVKSWAYLWEMVEENIVILMQYIGLRDKNNVDIYEGDIVRFSWGNECSNCHKTPMWSGKVTFGSLGARVQGFLIADPQNNILDSVEVIGNVHKNPELLE